MARRPRRGALLMLGAITVMAAASMASPAHAIVDGDCDGNAKFSNGTTVEAKQSLDIVSLIPPEDTVRYTGSIDIPKPPDDSPIPFNGGVDASVAGIGTINVVDWGGETVEIGATGDYSYEVPSWVPKGTGEILVTATHTQGGKTCVAEVNVTLDGSPGAAAIIGATGTVLFGAGTLAAGRKKGVA